MKSERKIINMRSPVNYCLGLALLVSSSLLACSGDSPVSYSAGPSVTPTPSSCVDRAGAPDTTPLPPNASALPFAYTSTPNLMGINIATPSDYEEDRLYADVVRMSREFRLDNENGSSAPLDANGWPTADFGFYLWATQHDMNGKYTLTFTGQATVTTNPALPIAITYNAASNTSSGTFTVIDASANGTLALRFASTKRMSTDNLPTGVTSIKLMRPDSPGSATSYPSTTLFNTPIKTLIAKFSVIRFMDFLATNANQQSGWCDRAFPSDPSFHRFGSAKSPTSTNKYGWQGRGGSWEHAILLANETNRDAWINIPMLADDNYITNVAKMMRYGSDGINPYSIAQANPKYPPLNANLKLYVEYSNEIWNSASAFTQFYDNCQLASNELATGNSPLNWDNLWNNVTYKNPFVNGSFTTVDNSQWNYTFCWRRPAKRTVEISNIFRSVFGDAEMMTRVRPLMMTQLTAAGRSLFDGTKMLLDYYNHMAGDLPGAPAARPPSYYIYGAGGSGYYNVTTPTALTNVDDVFTSPDMLPPGFTPELVADTNYTTALGVKRVAYEGGPSFDNVNATINGIYAQAVLDSRMTSAIVNMHNEWSANNGDLLVYYRATGDAQWGFTPNILDLATPKLLAIDALNNAARTPITFGTLIPATLAGSAASACSRNNFTCSGNSTLASSGGGQPWQSYSFRSSTSAVRTVTLTLTNPVNSTVAVYVDGVQIGTTQSATSTMSFNAGTLGVGVHGVIVRAVTGTFSLTNVAVTP